MRIFLDEIYDRRVRVISFVSTKRREVSIKEIAEATNLSKKTISMIIRQFEQELQVPKESFKVSYVNQTIKGVYACNIDLDNIGSMYLKKSVLYKMIYYIFLYEKIDPVKFCELEYISLSTFSRYRKKLQEILEGCGLKLSRVNKILGEELKIRNFFFLFFSKASSKWVFGKKEYEEIAHYLSENNVEWKNKDHIWKNKVCLLIYISNIRSSQKNTVDVPTLVHLTQKYKDSAYTTLFFEYFTLKRNKDKAKVWAETSFVMLFMYKERFLEEYFVIEEYGQFFNEKYFSFVKYSEIFVQELLKSVFDGSEDNELYWTLRKEVDLMHLTLLTNFIDLKQFYYIYDEANFFHKDEVEKAMYLKIEEVVEHVTTNTAYKNFYRKINCEIDKATFANYTYLIVYTIQNQFLLYHIDKVKILLRNSKVFIESIIAQKIKLIFGDSIEFVDDDHISPDIIVTDVHISNNEQIKEVFVSSFSDYADFSRLLEEIKKEIVKKYNNRQCLSQSIKLE